MGGALRLVSSCIRLCVLWVSGAAIAVAVSFPAPAAEISPAPAPVDVLTYAPANTISRTSAPLQSDLISPAATSPLSGGWEVRGGMMIDGLTQHENGTAALTVTSFSQSIGPARPMTGLFPVFMRALWRASLARRAMSIPGFCGPITSQNGTSPNYPLAGRSITVS